MELDKNCSKCTQKSTCQSVYEAMGKHKGPSVALKVIVVFLLPILMFISGLVICEYYLKIENKSIKTAISALLSAVLAFIYVLIAKAVIARQSKKKDVCQKEIKEN
jgi:uncharacterized membrane protein